MGTATHQTSVQARGALRAWRNFLAGACALALSAAFVSPALAADDWQEGAGADWQAMLAKAKTEGCVVLSMGAPVGEKFAEAFQRDTGVKLDFLGGTTQTVQARFMREVESANLTIDIQIGGSGELALPRDQMQPIQPLLVLPKVKDGKYWTDGHIFYIDSQRMYFPQAADYVSFRVFANADKVNVADLKKFEDLLDPKYKGKIVSADPTGMAGGQGFSEGVMNSRGAEFLEKLYKGQDIRLSRNGTQLVEMAVRGTNPIVIGALQADIDKFVSQGFNLQYVDFADWPNYSTGGRSVVKMPKNAPHPNAAAVFVNWFLSKPGQELYEELLQEPSRRTDVAHKGIPSYMFLKPGIDYIETYNEEYITKLRPVVNKKMMEIFNK
ncbi:MAG TPA: extracellular solute-binding protein [Alphaproteobacteria bacterium]|jgi:ABC-type Fe3+ transport system substrate-binding protein